MTTFREFDSVIALDLANPDATRVILNESGSIPPKDVAHGWSWSPMRQALLYFSRASGDDVHEFRLKSGNWRDGTWTWGQLTAASNSLVPATAATGIYSRFQVASYADAEIVVMVNSTSGPVYAFRVPEPTRPLPPQFQ